MKRVLHHLFQVALLQDGLTDRQLLESFLDRRGEAAFAALLRRHGPMVWGICRRVLHNYHDAEDAFQATFLVLVRKAIALEPRDMIGNWLYGVAYRTAARARARTAKRGLREKQVPALPEPPMPESGRPHHLAELLDRELSCLPQKYRVAIVLCDLEGQTGKETAQQLGVPEGTLAARLARGRKLLAKRLAQHGLTGA